MKHLLLISAISVAVAGCTSGAVQRNLPPNFGAVSSAQHQLEFYRRSKERAPNEENDPISAGRGPWTDATSVGTDAAQKPGNKTDEKKTAGDAVGDSVAESSAVGDSSTSQGEADTASDGHLSGPTEPKADGEGDATAEAGTGDPGTPTKGGKKSKNKHNPSCENSGGKAATCG